ncbi:MAG: trypsin-like serine protease [Bacteroidales bacterium]|nr:trypsin-like serine protease [Bacteroidales bacterium]
MSRIIVIICLLLTIDLAAQISEGGIPYSYAISSASVSHQFVQPDPPNLASVFEQDNSFIDEPVPYRIGIGIPVDISLSRDGSWSEARRGKRYLSLGIKVKDAKGIILYYRSFNIPEGGKLFIYSRDRSQLIGAFTSKNNPSGGYFATELIYGDELVIEYDAPKHNPANPIVDIYQVQYIYRNVERLLKGDSGPCEVNVNCPEGAAWQNEKRSVAKIVLKAGFGTYLCTGALVNNTREDSIPYFLTARHCGTSASLSDYSQWVFHFNYEALSCEDPLTNPQSNTITGSSLLAQAPYGTTSGSDFKLLQLSHTVPENYNPYLSGWSRNGLPSASGVGIHHPKGDIKKISTYTSSLVSTQYGQSSQDPNGMYWKVIWAETANGHGVTEGGSSGSPIFNNTGKIVGTLTGGSASCTELTAPDYYGKFSSHWTSNGSLADAQLKPYLDPNNTGLQSLDGFGYGSLLTANFKADTSIVSIGGQVSFTDQSIGNPEYWYWTFFGGDPSLLSYQHPGSITYRDYGVYDVKLIIGTTDRADTLLRKSYIRVTPNLYPNPANEYVIMDFGRRQLEFIEVEVFDLTGQLVKEYSSSPVVNGIFKIPLGDISAGTYILHIKTNIMEDNLPLIIY